MPGYTPNICTYNSQTIRWFDWRTVGISLKPFQGQNIKIVFTTYDCKLGGHFGYAYLYAYCMPRQINMYYCAGSPIAKLIAPNGFKYKWIPGGDTTQTITINNPVLNNIYSCIITSNSNAYCIDTLTTKITPHIIESNFIFSNTCLNQPVQFINNTPINHWKWDFGDPGSPGNTINMGIQVSHIFSGQGSYNVTLIDSLYAGCGDTVTKTITIFPTPVLSVNNPTICSGESVTITVAGGNNCVWDDGFIGNSRIVFPNITTIYTIIGSDTNGCSDTIQATVTAIEKPQASIYSDYVPKCEPLTINFTSQVNPPQSNILWDFGDGQTSNLQNTSHTYYAGTYNISLNAYANPNCYITKYLPYQITVFQKPHAEFTWAPYFCNNQTPLVFTNLSTSTFGNLTYIWDFKDNSSLDFSTDPSHLFTYPGFYDILLISSNNLCSDSVTHTITIINKDLNFPNIITPNGDGINDFLVIKGLDNFNYPENQLEIYNRWGKKVYEKNNYNNEYGGNDLPDGTYFYIFKAKGIIKNIEHSGSLEILR